MELRDRLQSTLGTAYSVERELGGGGMELETALDKRELVPQHLLFIDRMADSVRQSERFAAIVRRVGLDPRTFRGPFKGRPASPADPPQI